MFISFCLIRKLPGGKQSYGMAEKIIDGITIKIDHLHIELDTRGKYKTETAGDWYVSHDFFLINLIHELILPPPLLFRI